MSKNNDTVLLSLDWVSATLDQILGMLNIEPHIKCNIIELFYKKALFASIVECIQNESELDDLKKYTDASPLVFAICFDRQDVIEYIVDNKMFYDNGMCYVVAIGQNKSLVPYLLINKYPHHEAIARMVDILLVDNRQDNEKLFFAYKLISRIVYNRYILEFMDDVSLKEKMEYHKKIINKLAEHSYSRVVEPQVIEAIKTKPGDLNENFQMLLRGLIEMLPTFAWLFGKELNLTWSNPAKEIFDTLENEDSKIPRTSSSRYLSELLNIYEAMEKAQSGNCEPCPFGESCLEPETLKDNSPWVIECRKRAFLWILSGTNRLGMISAH